MVTIAFIFWTHETKNLLMSLSWVE